MWRQRRVPRRPGSKKPYTSPCSDFRNWSTCVLRTPEIRLLAILHITNDAVSRVFTSVEDDSAKLTRRRRTDQISILKVRNRAFTEQRQVVELYSSTGIANVVCGWSTSGFIEAQERILLKQLGSRDGRRRRLPAVQ